ncbi:hypothetical protein BO78DRAFT_389910 [Aspergillus sclerotiicarbonarius CBS 121057]|uniref:DUF7924 domain-containing protein n=1 Tax=Aspergillus sclerotiicarbonarius (strain CBS 121057 / IBT 28362) TaxID=1448318 RepID=A0A319DYT8_ASPSB|nr:hypothetical protein BO78DRAFT_389910 [Aspergillus sclerotiicarbonarius CBS 121057]
MWETSKENEDCARGEDDWRSVLKAAIKQLGGETIAIIENRDWRSDIKPPNSNLKVKDPRPDICVGVRAKALEKALAPTKGNEASNLLSKLQDNAELISYPYPNPIGLKFPFLVAETKSGATGGNLFQAQNQAAVGGSGALRMFTSLSQYHARVNKQANQCAQLLSIPVFSLTTEGPIIELWVHFHEADGTRFNMTRLHVWCMTIKSDCLGALIHISAILKWGSGELKDTIVNVLSPQ